jgi:cysteine dioxygenase
MHPTLRQFLDGLDLLGRLASLDQLAALVDSCPIGLDALAPYVRFSDEGYARNPVRTTSQYQTIVLCWRPGQSSSVHDHPGSACAVRVVSGAATETTYVLAGDGTPVPVATHTAGAGEVLAGQDADIHRVANLGPDDLITLHVYSPPLLRMNRWPNPDVAAAEGASVH